jgi:crotonobetainyl-CoA:carnitine CoA-transferase CaiB-like acyl-CoA transferase
MEELGFGYEAMRQANPSIIHASVTGQLSARESTI